MISILEPAFQPSVLFYIVKFFTDQKGFDFIKDANSPKKFFGHSTGFKDIIRENDEVTFELQERRKDLNAVNVGLHKLCNYTFLNFIPSLTGFFVFSCSQFNCLPVEINQPHDVHCGCTNIPNPNVFIITNQKQ